MSGRAPLTTRSEALCGTSWKVRYDSRAEAVAEVKRLQRRTIKAGNLRPYHCACGHWHLTTMSKQAAKRLARARRAA